MSAIVWLKEGAKPLRVVAPGSDPASLSTERSTFFINGVHHDDALDIETLTEALLAKQQ